MLKYILKRLLGAIPMLFIITIVCFTILQSSGDPVKVYVTPKTPKAEVERIRENLGLNDSLIVQYGRWVKKAMLLDFGYSFTNGRLVTKDIGERVPNTLYLMGISLLISLLLGMVIGLLSAFNKGKFLDKFFSFLSYLAISIPGFWFAIILIIIFSYTLKILPSTGMHTVGKTGFLDLIAHSILPVTVLSIYNTSVINRYIRANAMSVMKEQYITVAYGKGIGKKMVLGKHILKNVLLPVITIIGLSFPQLISGAFITESIFAWPGMGSLGVSAISGYDYPMVLAIILFSALLLIVGSLLSDILYGVVDPRVRVVNK